jgi:Ca2+-dependent lipid-binding protein
MSPSTYDKKLRLTLTVLEATNIPKKDLFSESDPFCRVQLYHSAENKKLLKEVRTRTLKDQKNPVWKTRFAFSPESYESDYFLFTIEDADSFGKNDEM